jgi:hypothetical protein
MKDSSKDGGAAEADKRAAGLMMTSAAAAIKDGVMAEAGKKSGGVDGDIGSSSQQNRKEAFERQKMAVDAAEYSSEDSAASAAATAWNAISGGDSQNGGRGGLNGNHGISSTIFWQLHHSTLAAGACTRWEGELARQLKGGVAVVDGGDGNWLVKPQRQLLEPPHPPQSRPPSPPTFLPTWSRIGTGALATS